MLAFKYFMLKVYQKEKIREVLEDIMLKGKFLDSLDLNTTTLYEENE